jgi:hypothetical protein
MDGLFCTVWLAAGVTGVSAGGRAGELTAGAGGLAASAICCRGGAVFTGEEPVTCVGTGVDGASRRGGAAGAWVVSRLAKSLLRSSLLRWSCLSEGLSAGRFAGGRTAAVSVTAFSEAAPGRGAIPASGACGVALAASADGTGPMYSVTSSTGPAPSTLISSATRTTREWRTT